MKIHNEEDIKDLVAFFKIFSDENRLRILDTLLQEDKCVNKIALELNMTSSAVSHQLKTLRTLKLVKTSKKGQNVTYGVIDEHIKIILRYGLEHIKEK